MYPELHFIFYFNVKNYLIVIVISKLIASKVTNEALTILSSMLIVNVMHR